MKVLVSDPISELGVAKLKERVDVDVKTDLTPEELVKVIGEYEALIVRSQTKVTAEVINAGGKLKVIGRAGVGVDNIDVEAATQNGVMVVNAPSGNTIATAEHSMAMMLSLVRNIPSAYLSLKNREWKKSKFVGVELYQKTLGVLGLGRIGSEVVKRAKSFGMEVLGYDPHISQERAEKIGVKLCERDEVIKNCDILTLHVPKTSKTYHFIGERELGMMKDGAYIINCARGGLIDEDVLYNALKSGKIAGAALDVFEEEPAVDSPLLELDNIIVTPHLGASTKEAQINVAVLVAEQVLYALFDEPVSTAINVAIIPPETLVDVKPFIPLMEMIGSFYPQVYNGQIETIEVTYSGEIANYPVAPLTTSLTIGFLKVMLNDENINYVNAPVIAEQRGMKIKEISVKEVHNFTNLITVKVKTKDDEKFVAGTLFSKNDFRIVQIDEYRIDVVPSKYMLVATYVDKPGVIGRVGTTLGSEQINIAGMQVGRTSIGGEAVMVLQVDSPINDEVLNKLSKLEAILSTRFVEL